MSTMLGIRLFLSILFLRTAWHKLYHNLRFRAELKAYQLLPDALVPATALLLGLAEISCALLLLDASSVSGLVLAFGLLTIYSMAMGINLARGRRDIDCGCSTGFSVRKTLDGWLVIRNLILILLALTCLLITATRDMGFTDYIQTIIIALTLSLVLESFEQALANAQRYHHWQLRRPT